jgi:hypothetical protein
MRHPFVVRLSNHDGFFSQLPFAKEEFSLMQTMFSPSLAKHALSAVEGRGKGRFAPR